MKAIEELERMKIKRKEKPARGGIAIALELGDIET